MTPIDDLVAADVMIKSVTCATPDEKLADLQDRLFDEHVGVLPVVENDRLVGIISRSEFVRIPLMLKDWRAYAEDELTRDGPPGLASDDGADSASGSGQHFLNLKVKDVMPSQVVTCSPKTSLLDVAAEMIKHHIHHIIVTEEDQAVGVISSLDIIKLMTTTQ